MTDQTDLIEAWISDFCSSSAFLDGAFLDQGSQGASPVREYAPQVLSTFLTAACAQRSVTPSEVSEADLKPALLEGVGRLEIPASVRRDIPALCAAFLAEMEAQGRLSDGRTLGLYLRALRAPYLEAAAGKTAPLQAAGAKLGRNDPCPCGSGRKYKKCCRGLLDS